MHEDHTRTLKLDDGVFSIRVYNRANAKMATLQLINIFSSDDVVSVDGGCFRPLSAAELAPAAMCGWSCAAKGWWLE